MRLMADPENADLHMERAQALREFGNLASNRIAYEQAVHSYTRTIELKPEDPEPRLERGKARLRLGKVEAAHVPRKP